ncbi:hypothetical protein, partial [Klebsiella pneumoniae]|uniref:hypothetical protein n=1 Tax=Klebsiella pneumoniae TaxID=573 RepID=UPI00210D8A70
DDQVGTRITEVPHKALTGEIKAYYIMAEGRDVRRRDPVRGLGEEQRCRSNIFHRSEAFERHGAGHPGDIVLAHIPQPFRDDIPRPRMLYLRFT